MRTSGTRTSASGAATPRAPQGEAGERAGHTWRSLIAAAAVLTALPLLIAPLLEVPQGLIRGDFGQVLYLLGTVSL